MEMTDNVPSDYYDKECPECEKLKMKIEEMKDDIKELEKYYKDPMIEIAGRLGYHCEKDQGPIADFVIDFFKKAGKLSSELKGKLKGMGIAPACNLCINLLAK